MSDLKESTSTTSPETKAAPAVDLKLEIVVVPVSDVERAKQFYAKLGWRLDADFAGADDYRVIQFTPPGSNASVIFGKHVTPAAPGSAQGLYLVVSDIEAARRRCSAAASTSAKRFTPKATCTSAPTSPICSDGPGQRRRSGTRQLPFLCLVQRSRRQWLAAAGSDRAIARPYRRQQHDVYLLSRSRRCVPPRGRRPWRAREAQRRQAR